MRILNKEILVDPEDEMIVNQKTWSLTGYGKLVTGFRRNGVHYTMQIGRYILIHYKDIPDDMCVCYKNGNPFDARKENLIIRTKSEKVLNSKKPIRSRSKASGIYVRGDRYHVIFKVNGKTKYFGSYKTKIEAEKRSLEVRTERRFGRCLS